MYLCVPVKNPLNDFLKPYEIRTGAGKIMTDFSFLNGGEFIFLEEWQPLQKRLRSFFKQFAVEPANRTVVNQVSTLLNMSAVSGNLCIASEVALACSGHADRFCLYRLPDPVSDRLIYVAYDKDLFVPEAAQELINLLTKTGGVTK